MKTKRIALLMCILAIGFSSMAQSYNLSKDTTTANYNLSDIYVDGTWAPAQIPVFLTNHSSAAKITWWVRHNNVLPNGWANSICDTGGCYVTSVSTHSFRLGPDSTTELTVDFFPQSTGSAVTVLHIYNAADTTDQINAAFVVSISGASGIATVNEVKDIYLSPVPAHSKLSIVYAAALQASKVEVFNVLGQLVQSENISGKSSQTDINVASLEKGVYFLRLYTTNNRVITRKFTKD